MHAVVRISISEEDEKELSTQERLRLVEDEMAKMRQNLVEVTKTATEMKQNLVEVTKTVTEMKQTLGKLVERSGEWSQSGLVTGGDLQTATNEVVKFSQGE